MAGYHDTFSISALAAAYRGGLSPVAVAEAACERAEASGDNPIWIGPPARARALARAQQLEAGGAAARQLPLYGIPFAVKDNIDVAGLQTTAGCPEFAYVAQTNAHVVERLERAGAICIGKTNLDQFATGLVGTRSPYGACRNSFDQRYISGGSSSGSAVAVALEQVSFALGTDTAGSGRIPAAFNNIVGLKPTRGLVSARGVVPACRSLDCVSIFALDCADALAVLDVAAGYDARDAFSRHPAPSREEFGDRLRFAVPRASQLEFFGDAEYARLYAAAVQRLQDLGARCIEIDFGAFMEVQRLLYEGPWVAERLAAIGEFSAAHPDALVPVLRKILHGAGAMSAIDAFKASYRLAELRRATEAVWEQADLLLTPAAATIYRIDKVENDPVTLNSRLGYYTNFANLLDLAAVNVPGGFRDDGLPFGVSLIAPAHSDRALAAVGGRMHAALGMAAGATKRVLPTAAVGPHASPMVRLAVVGAHLSGLPLNDQLTSRGATLVRRTLTAPHYRLYALADAGAVQRPGMVRSANGLPGMSIEVEVWQMSNEAFGSFVAAIPPPLGVATIELADGEPVKGFICEHYAVQGKTDISAWGGWRNWLNHGARSGARQ